jgi:PAS domain
MVVVAPFSAVDPERRKSSDAADIVKRRRLPLSDFASEDTKLSQAHAYWNSKRQGGLLPPRRDIDIVDLRPLIGFMHLVDVVDAAAGQFKFRLHGTRVRLGQSFSENVVENISSKAMRDAAVEDYQSVCFTGVPCYQHVVALVDFVQYSYSRLILPMATDGRAVDALMICINARKFSDFSL